MSNTTPDQDDDTEQKSEFDAFEELARKLVAVPKSEIDKHKPDA